MSSTGTSPLLVAVVGAAGHLGRKVIEQGLERGMSLRAISPHIAAADLDPRVARVAASDADHGGLVRAFSGCDAVVMVFPASLQHPERFPEQIRNIFAAAREAGVKRLVGVVGSAGSLTAGGERLFESDYFEETTRHYYAHVSDSWNAWRNETELDWVAVVPAARMQRHMQDRGTYRWRTDEHLVTTDERSRRYFDVSQISYGDCARAILDEVQSRRHSRQFLTLGY